MRAFAAKSRLNPTSYFNKSYFKETDIVWARTPHMVPQLQDIIDVANQMLWTCLMLSLPPLLTALVVGVSVSLMQTVTSIQEMTLTFVPKLLAVVAVVSMAMPWLIDFIGEYFENTMAMFSSYH